MGWFMRQPPLVEPHPKTPFGNDPNFSELDARGGQPMQRIVSYPVVLILALIGFTVSSGTTRAQEPVYQPVNLDNLAPIDLDGFGDPGNTWAASMKWFKGSLFVGTLRWEHCVFAATLSVRLGVPLYPPRNSDCAPDPRDLQLAAEIWRFTPADGSWDRVYLSPTDVPVAFDPITHVPTKFTARDIAYPSMATYTEKDGTEALYVGAMSPTGMLPPEFQALGAAFPPRLLRTVDGSTFTPVPQGPGTFLGSVGGPLPGSASIPFSFGELASVGGHLVGLLRTTSGGGATIVSSQPGSGNDAWTLAGPVPEELPVSAMASFNDALYVGVGAPGTGGGYAIFKADLAGNPPFDFFPIVVQPQSLLSQRVVSFAENQGRLYAGTSWPTEILRIDPDDSWELVVGEKRDAGNGVPSPLSGIPSGFGNAFNVQFSTMASHDNNLYVGSIDASVLARFIPPLAPLLSHEFGFDLLRSEEGVYWYPVSRNRTGKQSPIRCGEHGVHARWPVRRYGHRDRWRSDLVPGDGTGARTDFESRRCRRPLPRRSGQRGLDVR